MKRVEIGVVFCEMEPRVGAPNNIAASEKRSESRLVSSVLRTGASA